MSKLNFQWIVPTYTRRGPTGKKGIRLSISKAGQGREQLVIAIYEDVMRKMRWVIGDRVEVGLDLDAGCLGLRRVPTGGYALSGKGGDKEKSQKLIGTPSKCVTRFTAPEELIPVFQPSVVIPPENLTEEDGLLVVRFGTLPEVAS